MTSPYRIEGPTQIAFSGGRSSAYMLYHILDAHDGRLPNSTVVTFQNTGREMPQTLDFVEACSRNWNIPVEWLEYDPSIPSLWKCVDYRLAARNGEPFAALVKRLAYLPNLVARFCTAELKIKRYMLAQGFDPWITVPGLRDDEPRRVIKSLKPSKERWANVCPMAAAGVTRYTVAAFWRDQPFDRQLPNVGGRTPLGNRDMCFLKSGRSIAGIMRDFPERAQWWIDLEESVSVEKGKLARFNKRFSLRAIRDAVAWQGDWIFNALTFSATAPTAAAPTDTRRPANFFHHLTTGGGLS